MKLYLIFFLFLLTAGILPAQDDVYNAPPTHQKKEKPEKPPKLPRKINSGFVFIDGKYIEPPYVVEQKELGKIYINGIFAENRLRLLDTVLNPYKIDTLPPILPQINKNTTSKDLYENMHYKNMLYVRAVSCYYNTHYPPKIAREKIIEYYNKLPCIKSFDGYTLEFYNGKKQPICIDDVFHVNLYKNFGIHSHRKLPKKHQIYKREQKRVYGLKWALDKNYMLIFVRYGENKKQKVTFSFSEDELASKQDAEQYILNKTHVYQKIEIPEKVKEKLRAIREKYIKEGKIRPEKIQEKNKTQNTGYIAPPLPQVSGLVEYKNDKKLTFE